MRPPISDDEVEEDSPVDISHDYLNRYILPFPKVSVKNYDYNWTGRPNKGGPPSFDDPIDVQTTCTAVYLTEVISGVPRVYGVVAGTRWGLEYGVGIDDMQGSREIVIDQINLQMHAWLPLALKPDGIAYQRSANQEVMLELLWVPVCPFQINGAAFDGGSVIKRDVWEHYYDVNNTIDQALDPLLRIDRLREGCKSLWRKRFSLKRECLHYVGAGWGDKLWRQEGGTGWETLGSVVGTIGAEPLAGEIETTSLINQQFFRQRYEDYGPSEKALFAPAQTIVDQRPEHVHSTDYVKVKRKCIATDLSGEQSTDPADNWSRGYLLLAAISDVGIFLLPGHDPYQAAPHIEIRMRIKFHQV